MTEWKTRRCDEAHDVVVSLSEAVEKMRAKDAAIMDLIRGYEAKLAAAMGRLCKYSDGEAGTQGTYGCTFKEGSCPPCCIDNCPILKPSGGECPTCHHSAHVGMCRVMPNGGPDVCCCTNPPFDGEGAVVMKDWSTIIWRTTIGNRKVRPFVPMAEAKEKMRAKDVHIRELEALLEVTHWHRVKWKSLRKTRIKDGFQWVVSLAEAGEITDRLLAMIDKLRKPSGDGTGNEVGAPGGNAGAGCAPDSAGQKSSPPESPEGWNERMGPLLRPYIDGTPRSIRTGGHPAECTASKRRRKHGPL